MDWNQMQLLRQPHPHQVLNMKTTVYLQFMYIFYFKWWLFDLLQIINTQDSWWTVLPSLFSCAGFYPPDQLPHFCGPHRNRIFIQCPIPTAHHTYASTCGPIPTAHHTYASTCVHAHTQNTLEALQTVFGNLTRLKHRYELASVIYTFIFRALEMI